MQVRTLLASLGVIGMTCWGFSYPLIGKERGFYGKLEIGFMKENWKYRNGYRLTIDRTLFTQDYQLGFNGYTLSPRLLSFDVRGNLRIDRSKYIGNGSETTTTLKGFGYYLNLRLLRGTFLPIHLYASRTYMPTRIIAGTFQQDVDTKIDSRGGSISFTRRNFYLTLSQNESDVDSVIQGVDYHNETRERIATFSYTGRRDRFSTSYTEVKTRTFSPFYTYFDRSKRFSMDLGLSRKTWNFSARTSYYKTLIGKYELYTESASFSYTPSTRFVMSVFANLNQYRGTVDTDYYSLSQNLNYRLTDSWSLSQSASLFALEETKSASVGGGISYNRMLTRTFGLGFSTSGSYSKWMNTEERDYYSYTVSGNVRKEITSLRTSLSLSASHSELFKDGDKASTTQNVMETIGIRLWRGAIFSHSANYTKSESREYDYKYEMVRSGNSVSWQGRVFRRVVLNYSIGVDYWKVMDTEAESVKPYMNTSGNFFLTRRLFVSFDLNLFRDTLYDNDYTVRGNFRVRYSFRKVSIVWDNGFNKEVFKDGYNYERSRYYTSLKLTRTF